MSQAPAADLPDAVVAGVEQFAGRIGVGPAAVYLAALWALLFRYGGQQEPPALRLSGGTSLELDDPHGEPSLCELAARAGVEPHLDVDVTDDGGELLWTVTRTGRVTVHDRAGRHDCDTLAAMVVHYGRLLRAGLAAPDAPVTLLDLLTPDEYHEQIHRWQGAPRLVREITVVEAFASRVAADPLSTAVVAGGVATSYGDLNAAANRIAAMLAERRVGPRDLVAFCLPRGAGQVAAALGILKAGAAFVPLDPAHPADRREAVIRDAAPSMILASGDLDSVALDRYQAADAPCPARPGDLAYVLYTSGSTGTPKGVMIQHRAVVNFADRVGELFDLTCYDRVLGYAACGYDVSIFETFGALLHGAELHIALDDERLNVRLLQRLIEDSAITVTDLPPSVMALLEPERFPELRVVFVGGEPFSGALVNRWNKGRRFVNGYGVTEATVTQIVQDCTEEYDVSPPIGVPMANHVAYVLDPRLRPVPCEVPGELVIGGVGLASGYLNRPDLTARAFVPNRLDPAAAARLYRTGDLVKRRSDGRLVFIGRIDRQIKIHGVRIEPGEIEAALTRHPSVRQALVERWVDGHGRPRLVGYVCPADGARLDVAELGGYLRARLPSAFVPRYLVPLDELPLNSSGKVDRQRLPTPGPRDTVTEAGVSR